MSKIVSRRFPPTPSTPSAVAGLSRRAEMPPARPQVSPHQTNLSVSVHKYTISRGPISSPKSATEFPLGFRRRCCEPTIASVARTKSRHLLSRFVSIARRPCYNAPMSRPRFQFRLRTLLLFVTAFAVWFGTLAKRANDQRRAVAAIKAAGASVIYSHQLKDDGLDYNADDPGIDWLRNLLGDDYFMTAVGAGFPCDSPDISVLRMLPNVRAIYYNAFFNRDDGLEQAAGFSDLEQLAIDGDITNSALSKLPSFPKLRTLYLWSEGKTKVSVAELGKLLERLPSLKVVRVTGIDASESQLSVLRQRFSGIKDFKLERSELAPHQ
jgi:hypothetical protein